MDNTNSTNIILSKIKNKYIFKQMFDYLQDFTILKLTRYNKEIQNKLNITINDYKKHAKIEIEIIPKVIYPNSLRSPSFCINIINIYERNFYHIFFNDNKKETRISRIDYYSGLSPLRKIKVIIDHEIKSLAKLFYECDFIEKINFLKFNNHGITNMSYMFYKCSSLREINFNIFNTDSVTDMRFMFTGCPLLKELNLSKFNTSHVTHMSGMFDGCSSLGKINVSSFDTKNVVCMDFMFSSCSSLKELNLSNFNTDNVYNMMYMFRKCTALKELNISNFNTNNIELKDGMFEEGPFSSKNKNIDVTKNKKNICNIF